MNMMKRLIYFALLMFLSICAVAQDAETVRVSGQVTDLQHRPVADVIVKLTLKGRILAFGTTDTKGAYSLSAKEIKEGTTLTFAHISYEPEEIILKNTGKKEITENMMLVQKSISLKEIKVRATPLFLKGDTLSYNLASFLGKGDVTLEDGLKRLPGVEVSKSGAISYMGKGISAFNIEGLDMLGGKYNLATRNMGADMVTKVEVVRNYHARKIDEDKPSDEVALNIKLAKKAKFKPFGQEEVGAGASPNPSKWRGAEDNEANDTPHGALPTSPHGEGLDVKFILGLTGMMFTDNFQTICSGKVGNYKDYGTGDLTYHFGGGGTSTLATSLFGGFGGGRPPKGESEYKRNGMATLNAIQKLDSTRTFKVNTDYTYRRTTNDMASASTYLTETGDYVSVSERTSPLTVQHQPRISIDYLENAHNRYTNESFTLKGIFERNEGDMLYNGETAKQRRRATSFEANNRLYITRMLNEHRYSINSNINFQRTPTLRLSFSNQGKDYGQLAQSTSLTTNHSTSFDIRLGKKFTLNLPVSLQANYNFVETTRLPEDDINRLGGWTLIPSFSPGFEWRNSNRRLYASIGVPFSLRILNYDKTSLTKFYTNPRLNLNYTFSANSKLSASTSISHGTGDMLDLLTQPMQTDYRTMHTASGIIGESRSWSSSAGWKLQIPLSYFTFDISASHTEGKRNTLYSQTIDGVDVNNQSLLRDTYTRSTSFSISSTKNIPSLFAKFGIRGNYSFGDSEQAVGNDVIATDNQSYNLRGSIAITPIQWVELNYNIDYGWSRSSYGKTRNTTTSLSHNGGLHIFPVPQLDLSANYDYVRRQIATDRHKHMSLFNASAQYKFKRAVLRLELDNLLNQRSYAYTVFDGINTYSYDYGLCGRTAIMTLKFSL